MLIMETPKPDQLVPAKANMGFDGSKRIRVIAKIRRPADLEAKSANWVCVHKPDEDGSDSVTVFFGEQPSSRKDFYKLDYCYEQNEDNATIFSREVKPLISGVSDGLNATIIAYGAKGSGKTHVIQGSEDDRGLAELTMDEILSTSEAMGKSVTISIYEIFQDHLYDLLDPKRPEVQVLENGQGKILLKGLTQVPVKSISEFKKLYINKNISQKPVSKISIEIPRRCHKGMIVHVSSMSDALPEGKINFVDLAGYEDNRRKSSDGLNTVESTKINKSIYALHNVVYALSANEGYVPYRESKLTRMLQDSLGGKNRILMVTCLNASFCQDSRCMLSLSSRCCQGITETVLDTTKKNKSSARSMLHSSQKCQLPGSVSTTKKLIRSQTHSFVKQANDLASTMKGRKLFDKASQSTKSKKMAQKVKSEKMAQKEISVHAASIDEASTSETEKKSSESDAVIDKDSTSFVEKVASPLATVFPQVTTESDKGSCLYIQENQGKVTPSTDSSLKALSMVEESQIIDKENNSSLTNKHKSPPISERLQEISNNLKQLISSTPLRIEIPSMINTSSNIEAAVDIVEPKTPDQSILVCNKWETTNMKSPWETFNMRSSGMKNSIVQEYLNLLNTGGKDDLKKLKGIGEKRANCILEMREETPKPFKNLDDLKDIGLSAKQIKGMMKKEVGGLFS